VRAELTDTATSAEDVDPFIVVNLGCGRTGKSLDVHTFRDRGEPVTVPIKILSLDQDARLDPDLVCALGKDAIPLEDNSVDLVVARHVLEHIGKQGETAEWFYFWEELYRVMKPGAHLQFESPLWCSVWSWADPSHTRALSEHAFVFFNQDAYRMGGSAISPFRIKCDFLPTSFTRIQDGNPEVRALEAVSHFRGVLVARKPLRAWWEGRV